MLSISISKTYTELLKTIRLHLTVIGKRATNVKGESFFVDLTTSAKEDKIFYDLIDAGAETIVSEISDVCSNYYEEDGVKFVVYNDRWEKGDEEFIGNLEHALEGAIGRYLVNFALAQFLSSIFPAVSNKSVPMYGKTYIEHCQVILKNIKTLAFHKRPDANSGTSYQEMLNADSEYWEDGKIISLLTIKRNGTPLCAYNGLADKSIDIIVPTKVSELENDKGYLTAVTDEMVVKALGYTPLNAQNFTRSNVIAMLGISDWALQSKKPSYSYSEITGLQTILDEKYDKADFTADFATELNKYQLGHKVAASGNGTYVTSLYENGDTIYYQLADFEANVKTIVNSMSGGFGTKVSWGTQGETSVYLNVDGTEKQLQLAGDYFSKESFVTYFAENWFYKYKVSDATYYTEEDEEVIAGTKAVGDVKTEAKYAIGTNFDLFSMKGISAFGYGASESGEGVSKFSLLTDVIDAGIPSETTAWGYDYANSKYGWVSVVKSFSELGDVTPATASEVGKAWGVVSVDDDGEPTYGWISGGKEYTAGTGITIQDGVIYHQAKPTSGSPSSVGILRGLSIDSLGHVASFSSSSLTVSDLPTLEYINGISINGDYLHYEKTRLIQGRPSSSSSSDITIPYATTAGGLKTAVSLWGNEFYGTSDINGDIIMKEDNGTYIQIGKIKLEYDSNNNALKVYNATSGEVANLYATGGISAYQYGASEEPTGVSSFADLNEVKTAGTPSETKYVGWNGTSISWLDGASEYELTKDKIISALEFTPIHTPEEVKQLLGSYVTSFQYLTGAIYIDTKANVNGKVKFSISNSENKLYGEVVGLGSAAYTESTAYASANHTHSQYLTSSDISGMLTTSNYASTLNNVYSKIGHTHSASDITTGTLDVARLPLTGLWWANINLQSKEDTATTPHFGKVAIGANAGTSYELDVDGNACISGIGTKLPSEYYHFLDADTNAVYEHAYGAVGDGVTYFHWRASNGTDYRSLIWGGCNPSDGKATLEVGENNTGRIRIGKAYLSYDETNDALKVDDGKGGTMNFFAMGGVAAYGMIGSVEGYDDLKLANSLTTPKVYLGSTSRCLYGDSSGVSIISDNEVNITSDGDINIGGGEIFLTGGSYLDDEGKELTFESILHAQQVKISSTLDVAGETTLSSTLNVTGATTLKDSLKVGSNGIAISQITFDSSTKELSFLISGITYTVTLS